MVEAAPVGDGVGDEFGAVVEADERGWAAALGGEAVERGDDVVGVDGAVNDDRDGFAGELVDPFSSFNVRPSAVTSNWKSIAHRACGAMGHMRPTAVPTPTRRFLRRL